MSKIIDNIINNINEKNKQTRPIVCIPDGDCPKMHQALMYLKHMDVVLLGDQDIIKPMLAQYQYDPSLKVIILQPFAYEKLINEVYQLTQEYKNHYSITELKTLALNNPFFATMLLKANYVTCVVGGSKYPSKDIIKPVLKLIKTKKDAHLISSYMLLQKDEEILIFSDCALNVAPSENDLVEIIYQTINSALNLGIKPQVALLSYSTLGSGVGPSVSKIQDVYQLFIKKYPQYQDMVYGEMQFDSAYDQEVLYLKTKDKNLKTANVFIFPDLNAGNIGYKIAQYLGKYEAIGPILQGVGKPVNDLSRNASSQEIAKVIYLTLANS